MGLEPIGGLKHHPPDDSFGGSQSGVTLPIHMPRGEDRHHRERGNYGPFDNPLIIDKWDELTIDQDTSPEAREPDPIIEKGANIDNTQPILGNDAKNKIRESVMAKGIDALAWYISFHYTGVQWGVYINKSSIAFIAEEVFKNLPTNYEVKCKLAYRSLLNHELFHFALDYVVAQQELFYNQSWYVEARNKIRNEHPCYLPVEEMLANAYMLKRMRALPANIRTRGAVHELREWTISAQGIGYNEAYQIKDDEDWALNLGKLVLQYLDRSGRKAEHPHLMSFPQIGFDWQNQFPIYPRIDWRYCPIFLVDDNEVFESTDSLRFYSKIESITETLSFQKQLNRLPIEIHRAWDRTRSKCSNQIVNSLDFKKWPKAGKNVWSVRVNASYRAHLAQDSKGWEAFAIGTHKQLDHG